ncbi:hypothetical protein WA026_016302 [Henosepilachna vigintioctopunctata]|uniref:HEAT repeat-containing protein 1 n=1 Tax=Henosepilachna vigintioctopunctata TaxID=420089 RepID=A0AAW1UCL4_9CUCU
MKNKPTRHKEENTFKFQPFSERLSTINIDIFHRVNHAYETESEENICFFYQDLEKWEVLNLTEGFSSFKKEIRGDLLVTLPQLIHNKEHVVKTLIKYLKLKEALYLQPLLSLTASLAKDLRKEFYEYYPIFYNVLLELLDTKDTDQLEWVFSCLAYFFKYLWRFLISDITKVFNSLLPLLSENKPEYINNFAAESFAFIARKVKDRRSFLKLLLKVVKNEQEGISGCGKLLFEVIKGVNGQFHSCAEEILPFYLESLSDPDVPQDVLLEILEYTIAYIVDYIIPQKSEIFWKSILTQLDKLSQNLKCRSNSKCEVDLENLLKLLGQAVEYKSGKLVQQPKLVIDTIVKLLNLEKLPEGIILVLVKISIVILLSIHIRLSQQEASLLVDNILAVENEETFLYFVDNIEEFSFFEALILPHFLKIFKINTDYLRVLTNVVLKKAPCCENGIKLKEWSKYPLDFRFNGRSQEIETEFLKIINEEQLDVERFFCSLVCISHLNLQEPSKFKISLSHVTNNLLEKSSNNCKNTLFLLNLTVETLLHLNHIEFFEKNFQNFLDILLGSLSEDNALCILNTLSLIISSIKDHDLININVLNGINKHLEIYFNSPYHEIYPSLFWSIQRIQISPEKNLKSFQSVTQ